MWDNNRTSFTFWAGQLTPDQDTKQKPWKHKVWEQAWERVLLPLLKACFDAIYGFTASNLLLMCTERHLHWYCSSGHCRDITIVWIKRCFISWTNVITNSSSLMNSLSKQKHSACLQSRFLFLNHRNSSFPSFHATQRQGKIRPKQSFREIKTVQIKFKQTFLLGWFNNGFLTTELWTLLSALWRTSVDRTLEVLGKILLRTAGRSGKSSRKSLVLLVQVRANLQMTCK